MLSFALVKHDNLCYNEVRYQLKQGTEYGLLFECYLFTITVGWVGYEAIAGDIFDHLIAAVSYFDLEVFEVPTGTDVSRLSADIKRFPTGNKE